MGRKTSGTPTEFGTLLRALRLAAGLTQEQLAERAHLSRRGVADLERGRRRSPYFQTTRRLAEALSLEPDSRQQLLVASRAQRPHPPPAVRVVGNLPARPTPLIGRDDELRSIAQLFTRNEIRLVTLTGAGGSGKSRLAVEAAEQLQERFPDGVFFVDLAPLLNPAWVASAIAQPVGVRDLGPRALVDGLKEYLASRSMLVLLDNFEHLLPAAGLVAELLEACPGLHVLVTSRAPLRLRWEHEVPVSPLPVPDLASLPPPRALSTVAAVALFIERARAIQPSFDLTDANADAVAQLCVRLDGLPLALELAARWVRVLLPAAIVARLDHGHVLRLTPGADRPTRHRTVEAAIAWSHDLLSESASVLFRRLAVFAGGWSLEAAEAVCSGAGIAARQVLDLLAEVAEQSLVTVRELPDGEVRYRFLEPIRDFARDMLSSSGEMDATQRAHATYMLDLVEQGQPKFYGRDAVPWLDRLELEHDNIRVALRWWADVGEPKNSLRVVAAIWEFWWIRGYLKEARAWLDTVVSRTSGSTPARASALNGAGMASELGGDSTRALTLFAESVALYGKLDDRGGLSYALCHLGMTAAMHGEPQRGLSLLDEALTVARAVAHPWATPHALYFQGQVAYALGQHDQAAALLHESLDLFLALGELRGIAFCRLGLAYVVRHRGRGHQSAYLTREALVGFSELGDTWGVHYAVLSLGLEEQISGEPARAIRLLGAAEAVGEAIGANILSVAPVIKAEYDRCIAGGRAVLTPKEFASAWDAGRRMSIREAIHDALSLGRAGSTQRTRLISGSRAAPRRIMPKS